MDCSDIDSVLDAISDLLLDGSISLTARRRSQRPESEDSSAVPEFLFLLCQFCIDNEKTSKVTTRSAERLLFASVSMLGSLTSSRSPAIFEFLLQSDIVKHSDALRFKLIIELLPHTADLADNFSVLLQLRLNGSDRLLRDHCILAFLKRELPRTVGTDQVRIIANTILSSDYDFASPESRDEILRVARHYDGDY